MKGENKHCMERRKVGSEINRMILIYLDVSNRMMLIHSNVSNFLDVISLFRTIPSDLYLSHI